MAPLSMEYSRQEYWSGLPFPAPGDLPKPGIKPHLLHLLHCQADSLPLQKPIIVSLVTRCKHVLTVYDFSLFSKILEFLILESKILLIKTVKCVNLVETFCICILGVLPKPKSEKCLLLFSFKMSKFCFDILRLQSIWSWERGDMRT